MLSKNFKCKKEIYLNRFRFNRETREAFEESRKERKLGYPNSKIYNDFNEYWEEVLAKIENELKEDKA